MSDTSLNTTDIISGDDGSLNHIANFYIFALCTVGLTCRGLRRVYKRKNTIWNEYFMLPLITLLGTLGYIILDLNHYFQPYDDETLVIVSVVQFIFDWLATVPIDVAYFLRLRVLLVAQSKFSLGGYSSHIALFFLVIPVTWIVVDVIGILSVFSENYHVAASYVFGIWNIGLAVNEIIMHSFFVYYIITSITSVSKKDVTYLTVLSGFVVGNSLLLLIGGLVSIFNSQIGSTIAYSSWLVNAWIFLALNEAVTEKIVGGQGVIVSTRGGASARTRTIEASPDNANEP